MFPPHHPPMKHLRMRKARSSPVSVMDRRALLNIVNLLSLRLLEERSSFRKTTGAEPHRHETPARDSLSDWVESGSIAARSDLAATMTPCWAWQPVLVVRISRSNANPCCGRPLQVSSQPQPFRVLGSGCPQSVRTADRPNCAHAPSLVSCRTGIGGDFLSRSTSGSESCGGSNVLFASSYRVRGLWSHTSKPGTRVAPPPQLLFRKGPRCQADKRADSR